MTRDRRETPLLRHEHHRRSAQVLSRPATRGGPCRRPIPAARRRCLWIQRRAAGARPGRIACRVVPGRGVQSDRPVVAELRPPRVAAPASEDEPGGRGRRACRARRGPGAASGKGGLGLAAGGDRAGPGNDATNPGRAAVGAGAGTGVSDVVYLDTSALLRAALETGTPRYRPANWRGALSGHFAPRARRVRAGADPAPLGGNRQGKTRGCGPRAGLDLGALPRSGSLPAPCASSRPRSRPVGLCARSTYSTCPRTCWPAGTSATSCCSAPIRSSRKRQHRSERGPRLAPGTRGPAENVSAETSLVQPSRLRSTASPRTAAPARPRRLPRAREWANSHYDGRSSHGQARRGAWRVRPGQSESTPFCAAGARRIARSRFSAPERYSAPLQRRPGETSSVKKPPLDFSRGRERAGVRAAVSAPCGGRS